MFFFSVLLLGGALMRRGMKHFSLLFCRLGTAAAEQNTHFFYHIHHLTIQVPSSSTLSMTNICSVFVFSPPLQRECT